jgi:hypothetical protein
VHAAADAAYRAIGALHHVRSAGERSAANPTAPGPTTPSPTGSAPPDVNELRRDGEVWHLTYGGASTIVRHSKGLADLAILLARPGREVHVTELEGVPLAMLGSRGGDALDRRAVAVYRERLAELAEELDDADSAHDLGRAERARAEYDALVEQLSSAVGVGGRSRAAGPEPIERLRKAVSARIRDAVRRIGASHAALGRHLDRAVRTGTYCSYAPEAPTIWRCQTGSGAQRA